MSSAGEKDLLARGLELVGAHQRGATLAVEHGGPVRDAVATLFGRGLRRVYAAHHQSAEPAAKNRDLASHPELKAALPLAENHRRNRAGRCGVYRSGPSSARRVRGLSLPILFCEWP